MMNRMLFANLEVYGSELNIFLFEKLDIVVKKLKLLSLVRFLCLMVYQPLGVI